MSELRPAIIRAHEQGRGVREIARFLNIEPMTVSRTIKRFEETGSNKDRPGRGRKKTARTPENVRKIKAKIKRNPSSRKNSARKLGISYGISKNSAHRILTKDLELKSWKPLKRHELTKKKRDTRKARVPALIVRFRGGKHRLVVFNDEKPFSIEQVNHWIVF